MRVVQALLTFLVNASWQVLLVVAFAALCDRLLRDVAARYRHQSVHAVPELRVSAPPKVRVRWHR